MPTSGAPGTTTIPAWVTVAALSNCCGTLGRDTERARSLLAKLVGPITLRRDGHRLVAELRGNLPALLELDDELYNRGAGSRFGLCSHEHQAASPSRRYYHWASRPAGT